MTNRGVTLDRRSMLAVTAGAIAASSASARAKLPATDSYDRSIIIDVPWARAQDGMIVQEGLSSSGQEIDWTVARIADTEMHWSGKRRDADGNWRLEAEFFGVR